MDDLPRFLNAVFNENRANKRFHDIAEDRVFIRPIIALFPNAQKDELARMQFIARDF